MISINDVNHIAKLSRINLSAEETQQLTKELEAILEYIQKLEQLDVSNVKPTSHVLPLENVWREDTAKQSLSNKEAMAIAVEQKNGYFKVPKVIE